MDRRVVTVCDLIKKDPWARVDTLATAVNLSSSRIQHLFVRQLGCSIKCYSQHELLSRAAALLSTTFLSVKEVQAAVGYKDPSAFCRAFKQRFGESPKAFRAHATYVDVGHESPSHVPDSTLIPAGIHQSASSRAGLVGTRSPDGAAGAMGERR
jgi:AraC-like DNA-binding protein